MFSQSYLQSRFAMPIVLVVAITLASAQAFSIPSKAYIATHHRSASDNISLFAQRPSKFLLNYAETDEELEPCVIDYDYEKESRTVFPFPLKQDMDLHGLDELAPLERHMLRMEGLDPYVLVSVLTSTTSYNTICGVDVFPNGYFDMISALLLVSSTVSAVCGIYATAVFSMCVLYGKTALGLDKEDLYYQFMESTGKNRIRGYKAFSTSLLLFLVNIFLIAIDKLPEPAHGPAAIIALATTYFGCQEFISITSSAAPMFQDLIPKDQRSD